MLPLDLVCILSLLFLASSPLFYILLLFPFTLPLVLFSVFFHFSSLLLCLVYISFSVFFPSHFHFHWIDFCIIFLKYHCSVLSSVLQRGHVISDSVAFCVPDMWSDFYNIIYGVTFTLFDLLFPFPFMIPYCGTFFPCICSFILFLILSIVFPFTFFLHLCLVEVAILISICRSFAIFCTLWWNIILYWFYSYSSATCLTFLLPSQFFILW